MLAARPSVSSLRCALCHDDLVQRAATCLRCGTALHSECSHELERCPSLGCGPWAPRRSSLDRAGEALSWVPSFLAGTVLAALTLWVVVAVVLAIAVHLHGMFSL